MCTKMKNQETTPHRVKYYKYANIPVHLQGAQQCTFPVSGVSLYLLRKDWMAVEHHFPELIPCFLLASFISVEKIKETMKNFKRQLLQNGDSIKTKNFVPLWKQVSLRLKYFLNLDYKTSVSKTYKSSKIIFLIMFNRYKVVKSEKCLSRTKSIAVTPKTNIISYSNAIVLVICFTLFR